MAARLVPDGGVAARAPLVRLAAELRALVMASSLALPFVVPLEDARAASSAVPGPLTRWDALSGAERASLLCIGAAWLALVAWLLVCPRRYKPGDAGSSSYFELARPWLMYLAVARSVYLGVKLGVGARLVAALSLAARLGSSSVADAAMCTLPYALAIAAHTELAVAWRCHVRAPRPAPWWREVGAPALRFGALFFGLYLSALALVRHRYACALVGTLVHARAYTRRAADLAGLAGHDLGDLAAEMVGLFQDGAHQRADYEVRAVPNFRVRMLRRPVVSLAAVLFAQRSCLYLQAGLTMCAFFLRELYLARFGPVQARRGTPPAAAAVSSARHPRPSRRRRSSSSAPRSSDSPRRSSSSSTSPPPAAPTGRSLPTRTRRRATRRADARGA